MAFIVIYDDLARIRTDYAWFEDSVLAELAAEDARRSAAEDECAIVIGPVCVEQHVLMCCDYNGVLDVVGSFPELSVAKRMLDLCRYELDPNGVSDFWVKSKPRPDKLGIWM